MRRGWWLAGLLLLAACTQWELPPVTEGSVMPGPRDWLGEVRAVQEMPVGVQAAELKVRQQAHQTQAAADSSLRLALLYALGDEAVRDPARALALLEELDPAVMGASQGALAELLRQWLRERQRSLALLRGERKALAEQEARIKELESQLEAVTSIEQSIRQRQKPLPGVEP